MGGIVLTTLTASFFDYLGKRRRKVEPQTEGRVAALEQRLESLEAKVVERDERIAQLETDLSFVNKLIEDKSR